MSDLERAVYFAAAVVAVFVLAFFVGSVLGPALDLGDRGGHHDAHAATAQVP